MRAAVVMFCALCVVCVYVVFAAAVTSPEMTARYATAQQERTQRYLAEQQTEQIRAEEWGNTLRTFGTGARDVAVVVAVAAAAGVCIVVWQRERTKRHGMTQQAAVLIAYRDTFGGRLGTYHGAPVVYLDDSREVITPQLAAMELRQARLLTVDAE